MNVKNYQQSQLNFKCRDSFIEEQEDWYEKELKPWGDLQLPIVAIMSCVQLLMLGLMLGVFWINDKLI
jgi:hypothetical protein